MRYVLLIIWLAFIGYALFFTPDTGGSDPYLRSLITLQSKEPSLMAMFSLLGLFPLAYACLLLRGDDRRIPAWPFCNRFICAWRVCTVAVFYINRFGSSGRTSPSCSYRSLAARQCRRCSYALDFNHCNYSGDCLWMDWWQ